MSEIAARYVTVYPKIASGFSTEINAAVQKGANQGGKALGVGMEQAVKQSAPKIGTAFKSIVGPILTASAAVAVLGFVRKSVDALSQLEDATGAASVIFGDSMDKIIAQSKTAATTMYMSRSQVIDAANTYGTLGKSAGLAGDDLAEFSTKMTQLAGDLASFKGGRPEDAVMAIGAALRGESEPIRRYGVQLDDATLRARAFKMGLIDTEKSALTPTNRTLAAQAEILAQTTDAQGDAIRTADSTANVQKRLAVESANLTIEIGEKLAPAIVEAQKAGIGFLTFVTRNQEAIVPLVATMGTLTAAVGGFLAVSKGLEALKAARDTIRGLGEAFQNMGTKAKVATVSAGAIGVALTAAAVVYGIFAQKNADAKQAVEDFTQALDASNGALDANVQAVARKRLEDAGALVAAQQLGLSLDTVTQAALGNTDAMQLVNDRMAESDAKWSSLASATTDEAKATGTLRTALGETSTALTDAQAKHDRLHIAAKGTTDATADNTGVLRTNTDAIETNTESLNKQYQARLTLRGDARALEAAIDDASESVKKNGQTLDTNTEKGRANQAALDGIASAALATVSGMSEADVASGKAGETMDRARSKFISTAKQMGMSEKAAKELAEKLGLIKSKDVTVDVKIKVRQTGQIDASSGLKVYVTGNGRKLMATGGKVPGIAAHDRDDKIPIMGTPEEWMIQRPAARYYGDSVMAAINSARIPRQALAGYATGGKVGQPAQPVTSLQHAAQTADWSGLVTALADELEARSVSWLLVSDKVTGAQRLSTEMA